MKNFFLAIVISLITISHLIADDINEFEINEMSTGDSALKFFSKQELNNKRSMYDDKRFVGVSKYIENSPYEGVSVEFEVNDKNLIIKAMNGKVLYDDKNFEDCYKAEKKIVNELKAIFKDSAKYNNWGISPHPGDKSGKSVGSHHQFDMNDGSGFIMVECMNWSEEMGFTDNLKVSIITDEFNDFLEQVYK